MIKFYTNRELAEKLGINLAKWKRWSRQFLPPDPLGGLQSGFARQYTLADAFVVHLGGKLVSDLKFTLPEASRILRDLNPWLTDNGFRTSTSAVVTGQDTTGTRQTAKAPYFVIYIVSQADYDFGYFIQAHCAAARQSSHPDAVTTLTFTSQSIRLTDKFELSHPPETMRALNISRLYTQFIQHLEKSPSAP